MRSIGGRTGVGMPVTPAVSHAYGRSSIRTTNAYLETFPNDGNMDVTSEDLTWQTAAGQVPVVSGAQCTTGVSFGAQAVARAEHDTGSTDQFVQCDWVTAASNDQIFLFAREDTAGGTDPNSDNKVYLFVYTPDGVGTEATIDNWAGSGTALTDGGALVGVSPIATWRLEVNGTTARCLRNGVEIFSGSISDFSPAPAGTRAGFELDSGSGHPVIDNFSFYDL